ncbi:oligosaccharide flippase family protein [Sulfurovum sp.]|uniref:oligosaccharide flippase family protein n=1 Tax=Sulfurovum sp. TaxID=1969726 RepID=UPI003565C24D
MKQQKYIIASLWSAGSQYIFFALNFLGQIALARLLLPEHFGVMALVLSIQGLLEIALSFSVPMAYMHFKETDTLFSSALTLSFVNWLLLMVITSLSLYPIYYFYQEEVALFIFLITIFRWFSSISSIYIARLEKNLDFKTATLITGIATIVAIVFAVSAAFMGANEYSLLTRELIAPLLIFVIAKFYINIPLNFFNFDRDEVQQLFKYSFKMFFSRGTSVLYQRLPFVFIGTYYTANTLGFVSQIFYLSMLYDRLMASFTQKIAFLFYSHSTANSKESKKGFFYINGFILIAGIPVFILFFFFPEWLLYTLWGEKWLDGAIYLKMMAPFALLYPMYENIKSYFYGHAENEKITYANIVGILSYFTIIFFNSDSYMLSLSFSISLLVMMIFTLPYLWKRLRV